MEDTIYRQEALEGLYDVFFDDELSAAYPKEADKVLDVIRKLPSAQPERKMGKWIKISPANIYECSECGKNVMTDDISAYDFCHGCGADMRTEGNDDN